MYLLEQNIPIRHGWKDGICWQAFVKFTEKTIIINLTEIIIGKDMKNISEKEIINPFKNIHNCNLHCIPIYTTKNNTAMFNGLITSKIEKETFIKFWWSNAFNDIKWTIIFNGEVLSENNFYPKKGEIDYINEDEKEGSIKGEDESLVLFDFDKGRSSFEINEKKIINLPKKGDKVFYYEIVSDKEHKAVVWYPETICLENLKKYLNSFLKHYIKVAKKRLDNSMPYEKRSWFHLDTKAFKVDKDFKMSVEESASLLFNAWKKPLKIIAIIKTENLDISKEDQELINEFISLANELTKISFPGEYKIHSEINKNYARLINLILKGKVKSNEFKETLKLFSFNCQGKIEN